MSEIIIIDLPKPHGKIKGCWYNGYPIHSGQTKESLNYATLYANQNKIIPDQKKLRTDFANFKKILKKAGFKLHILPFPEELNQINNLHHDAVFIRDAGLLFKDMWIKARFSAKDRQIEADVHAKIISEKFAKKIVNLPKGAYLEFGEVFYLKTKNRTIYFGGLSRSNKKGHDFVKSIINPDQYCLIKSNGYHLDTVFSPILNKNNVLTAFLIAKNMIFPESLKKLALFQVDLITVDPIDSSGEDGQLGDYAINTLLAPGIMANCSKFQTKHIEQKLKKMEIQRYISPLTYFRFAGGSYHCLTNEIYS